MKNETEINKEEYHRDLWYKEMSERITVKPEEEPVVGLVEWVDIMRGRCIYL